MNSTPDRGRTMAELTLTEEGEKGTGHGYFFHTQSIGTFYLLLAKSQMWNELRPTLTAIMANLAFAPQGVAAIQEQGQRLAAETPVVDGATLSPVAMIRQASQRAGRQVPLQPAALPDQSMSLQIPQGWNLEGQGVQFIVTNNPQTRTHGMAGVWHTIIPMDIQVPGAINAPYQAPPQALALVLESGKTSRNVQILSQCSAEQVTPETTQAIQQMRAQGYQVDARLLHIRFQNVPTGTTLRGLFSVMCSTMSMSPVWQVTIQGSWAPENEFDDWLPLFLRIEKTMQINQQWMGQEMQNRAVRQQQLNRNLQTVDRGVESGVRRLHGQPAERQPQPGLHRPHVEPDHARPGHVGGGERRGARLSNRLLGHPGPRGPDRQFRVQHDQLHGREPLGRQRPGTGGHPGGVRAVYRESMI